MQKDVQDEFCRELSKVLSSRISTITEEEIKTLDKDLNHRFRRTIERLKTITDKFPMRYMFELDFTLGIRLAKSQQIGRKL